MSVYIIKDPQKLVSGYTVRLPLFRPILGETIGSKQFGNMVPNSLDQTSFPVDQIYDVTMTHMTHEALNIAHQGRK